MNKEHILKPNFEFQRIINKNKPYRYKGFNVYLERNTEETYYFGFSVGKKIGNAVTRNKLKRQIKSIVSKKKYKKGFKCIIIVGKNVLNLNYFEMSQNLWEIFKKINILEEFNEEK